MNKILYGWSVYLLEIIWDSLIQLLLEKDRSKSAKSNAPAFNAPENDYPECEETLPFTERIYSFHLLRKRQPILRSSGVKHLFFSIIIHNRMLWHVSSHVTPYRFNYLNHILRRFNSLNRMLCRYFF